MSHLFTYKEEIIKDIPQKLKSFKGLPYNYDDDLDTRIHNFLKNHNDGSIESITLPISLTNNFLEFSGLIIAHHIRLTRELSFCDKLIIVYGSIELIDLLKITPLARILITPNVEYLNISEPDFFDKIVKLIDNYSYKNFNLEKFVKQICLQPPVNYESNHSVDNEFALIQWSKYIGCYENLPLQIKKEFDSRLYFKYLKVINPLPSINEKKQLFFKKVNSKIKILLIDDESDKGWNEFYKCFFNSSSNLIFFDSKINFKAIPKQEIINEIKNLVEEKKPDVVLLDLLLQDEDFKDEIDNKDFTGVLILKKIKEINKGIQVIVTSASNKILTYEITKKIGANGYILKNGYNDVANSIELLHDSINDCIKKAEIFKDIYSDLKKTINNWEKFDLPKRNKKIYNEIYDSLLEENIKLQVKEYLENAFNIMESDCIKDRFTLSILFIFRVIEMINEFFIVEEGDYRDNTIQYFFDLDKSEVKKVIFEQNEYKLKELKKGDKLSTREKCFAIYHKLNGNFDKQLFEKIKDIVEYRNNNVIHPKNRYKEETLEYLYDNDYEKFKKKLYIYFTAVLGYVSSITSSNSLKK